MTEKQYAPTKNEKKVSSKVETPKEKIVEPKKAPKQEKTGQANKLSTSSAAVTSNEREKKIENKETKVEGKEKIQDKKEAKEKKKPVVKKVKKEEVSVRIDGAHISSKKSFAICKFIKGKTIEKAIEDLEKVLAEKLAVPMKGEVPHKKSVKGLASGSGRYPKYATQEFIRLLKSLNANAINHDVDEPVITEAVANFGNRPLGRFGRWQRKRTHIVIKARSKIKKEKENSKKTKEVKEKKQEDSNKPKEDTNKKVEGKNKE